MTSAALPGLAVSFHDLYVDGVASLYPVLPSVARDDSLPSPVLVGLKCLPCGSCSDLHAGSRVGGDGRLVSDLQVTVISHGEVSGRCQRHGSLEGRWPSRSRGGSSWRLGRSAGVTRSGRSCLGALRQGPSATGPAPAALRCLADRDVGLHGPPGLHVLLRAGPLAVREAAEAAAVLPAPRYQLWQRRPVPGSRLRILPAAAIASLGRCCPGAAGGGSRCGQGSGLALLIRQADAVPGLQRFLKQSFRISLETHLKPHVLSHLNDVCHLNAGPETPFVSYSETRRLASGPSAGQSPG